MSVSQEAMETVQDTLILVDEDDNEIGSFDDLSGSVSDDTVIKFGNDTEKRQIENLQKLFALGVEFPFLMPVIRRLIRLPSNQFFWLLYKLFRALPAVWRGIRKLAGGESRAALISLGVVALTFPAVFAGIFWGIEIIVIPV